jgi:hypothetical protein
MGAAAKRTNEGKVLRGEAAILYAERTGGRLRVTCVTDFRPEKVREMLAMMTPRQRAEIEDEIVIEVTLPEGL